MAPAETILLVEDHEDTAAALVEILSRRGYAAITAGNGQRALELLHQGLRPRLILIDLLLPGMSGWDILDALRADAELQQTPTIVITAVPKEQVRVIATAVFSKPLDFVGLTATIDSLIGHHV